MPLQLRTPTQEVVIPDQVIIDGFHQLYYTSQSTWMLNTFLGYTIYQSPTDMYLYQELITRIRPPFIVQTGVALGGSILYFATLLDLIGADPSAVVVGVDIQLTPQTKTLTHPRIRLIEGSSTDPATFQKVRELLPTTHGMVCLDSDHSQAHVAQELQMYRELVAVGSYLVVEDTNINGHPVYQNFGPGPFEAVEAFLPTDSRFTRENHLWQRQLFSFHQFGWLRRIA